MCCCTLKIRFLRYVICLALVGGFLPACVVATGPRQQQRSRGFRKSNRTAVCGEPLRYDSVERQLIDYWGLAGAPARSFGDESPEYLAAASDAVQYALLSCVLLEGRLWEIRHPSAGFATVCFPAACNADQIRMELLPLLPSRVPYSAREALSAGMTELVDWAELPLDFALIGIDGCGTTSLRYALEEHPSVCFSKDTKKDASVNFEDPRLVWSKHANMMLPTRELVESLRESRQVALQAKPRCRAYGYYFAIAFRSTSLLEFLHRVPGLKLVLVVCDPVRRMESMSVKFRCKGDSFCSLSGALNDAALREKAFGPPLQRVTQRFGRERLYAVFQDLLTVRPMLDELAGFLGVGPLPPEARILRYHVTNKGQLTDFCSNNSLAMNLKGWLRHDYRTLEEALDVLGMPRPASLRQRRNRCDQETGPVRIQDRFTPT